MKTLISLFLVLLASTSWAGNILSYYSDSDSNGISKVYILPGKVRTEYRAGKKDFAMIYRGDKHLVWLINYDKHTVTEDLERNLIITTSEPQEKTANPSYPVISHRSTLTKDQVGAWSCEVFDRLIDKKLHSKYCAVELSSVGLEKESVETLKKMENMLRLFKSHSMMDVLSWDKKWLSVRIVNALDSRERSTSELKSVEQSNSIEENLFEIPKGFQKFNIVENIKIHSDSKK